MMWEGLVERVRAWLRRADWPDEAIPNETAQAVQAVPLDPVPQEAADAGAVRLAVDAHDWDGAIRAVGQRLGNARATAEDMGLAAVALRGLGRDALAAGFEAVKESPGVHSTMALAGDLLTHGDPSMALAVARFGANQIAGDAPGLAGIAGEALARLGRHDEALHVLEGYVCRWPDPALLRRYVLSALMTQSASCLDLAAKDLRETPELRWLVDALKRHGATDSDTPAARRGYLVAYGGLLISDGVLPPRVLPSGVAVVVERLALALEALGGVPDRVTSFSAAGDCLARWIARRLGVMPIPLTARIEGQSVLGISVDATDTEALRSHDRWDGSRGVIFQWSHEVGKPMSRPPEILGGFGADCVLPFEGLEAALGADRVPHSTAFEAAYQRSGAGAVVEIPASWSAWVAGHRTLFQVAAGADLDMPYLGDVPAPSAESVAEEEATEAGDVPTETTGPLALDEASEGIPESTMDTPPTSGTDREQAELPL